jgi:uncharacterized protein YnzC (UPF0291/DUF896 family)
MTDIQIARINELARKSKVTALDPIEKEEQQKLREEYRAAMKRNLESQLMGYRYEPKKNEASGANGEIPI